MHSTLRNTILSFLLSVVLSHSLPNSNPVIGILTIPSDYTTFRDPELYSSIQTEYIQFIESAGARVIPIPYDLPLNELIELFQKINGLLLTGGGTKLWDTDPVTNIRYFSKFTNQSMHLINLALQANLVGDHFPIWGTCQGLEVLAIGLADDPYLLDTYRHFNAANGLEFSEAATEYSMFGQLGNELTAYAENNGVAWYYHQYGLNPQTLEENIELSNMFEALAYGKDSDNKTFVAALEGIYLPIYMTQFHPERNGYEWFDSKTTPIRAEDVQVSVNMANVFVNEARRNSHQFDSEEDLQRHLIHNYPTDIVPNTLIPTYYFYKSV